MSFNHIIIPIKIGSKQKYNHKMEKTDKRFYYHFEAIIEILNSVIFIDKNKTKEAIM